MICRSWNIPPGARDVQFDAKIVKFLGAVNQGQLGIAVMAEVNEAPRAGSRLLLPPAARVAPQTEGANKVSIHVALDEEGVPGPVPVRAKESGQTGLAAWHFLGGVSNGEGVLFVYAFVWPNAADPIEVIG